MESLERRVERLERRLSRWRMVTVLVLLFSGGVLFLSMSRPQEAEEIPPVLRTRRLEIYNARGRSVLVADAEDDGNGFFCLMNREGREVLKAGAAECPKVEDSGFLALHGRAARLVFDGEGDGAQGVAEMGTQPLFFKGRSPETAGFLALRNTEDEAGVSMGCGEIAARDKSGKAFFHVYLDVRGRCRMTAPKR